MNTPVSKKSRGRPRNFDKEQALAAVLDLFRKNGFDSTSLENITDALKINKPSLYSAFGNKEQLFLEALKAYISGPTAYFYEVFSQATTKELVRQLLIKSIEVLFYFDKAYGCLIVMSTASRELEKVGIQQTLVSNLQQHQQKLAERFAQAVKDGELKPSVNAERLALYVVTLHKGLSLQAINGSSKNELLELVDQVSEFWPTVS